MSLKLTKDTTATPDEYSSGTGLDPITVAITLDGTNTPATVVATPVDPIYAWADDDTGTIDNYSTLSVSIVGSDTGITWELSLDGSTGWASSKTLPSPMDVSVTHATTRIYTRATAINDGSVATNNYTTADIELTGTSNPA